MGKSKRSVTAVVALTGAAIIAGLFKFNYGPYSDGYNMYLIVNLMALMWVPMLVIMMILREDPSAFGFTASAAKRTWSFVGVLFIGLLIAMAFFAHKPAFQDYYPIFRRFWEFRAIFDPASYPRLNPFVAAPGMMLYAELSYGMYLFCWEFFFRGYLLFGLQRWMGWFAVIVQAVAFGLLHWGKPEMLFSFGGGLILGIIALNAKSFLPAFVLHWAAAISFDIMVVFTRPHL